MAFIFTYECPPTNGVRIDCITYSQLIFMPKKEKRVQSSSLQQSFSIRNDKLFYLSLSVRLQRTGLLEVTFDCRDCKPSLREFSQSYFSPTQGQEEFRAPNVLPEPRDSFDPVIIQYFLNQSLWSQQNQVETTQTTKIHFRNREWVC